MEFSISIFYMILGILIVVSVIIILYYDGKFSTFASEKGVLQSAIDALTNVIQSAKNTFKKVFGKQVTQHVVDTTQVPQPVIDTTQIQQPVIDTNTALQEIAVDPQPCEVGDWSPWTCSNNVNTRTRGIVKEGTNCPTLIETDSCAPVDCAYTPWSDWSCNANTGMQKRDRAIISEAKWGGAECDMNMTIEEKPCDPVNCVMGEWSIPVDVPAICPYDDIPINSSTKSARIVISPAKYGGACPVSADSTEYRKLMCANATLYPNNASDYLERYVQSSTNFGTISVTIKSVSNLVLYGVRFYRVRNTAVPFRRVINVYKGDESTDFLVKTATVFGEDMDTSTGKWIAYKFDAPIKFTAGQMYTITLKELSMSLPNPVYLDGLNTMLNIRNGNIINLTTTVKSNSGDVFYGPYGLDLLINYENVV